MLRTFLLCTAVLLAITTTVLPTSEAQTTDDVATGCEEISAHADNAEAAYQDALFWSEMISYALFIAGLGIGFILGDWIIPWINSRKKHISEK